MGKLDIAVLGTPEVRHDGRVLRFSVVRALAVLLYIAVQGGLQPIKKLIELFWPGLDWEAGRDMLQKILAVLSQELQEDVSPHIISTYDALECNCSPEFLLDLFTVQRALHALYSSSSGAHVPYQSSEPLSEALLQEAIACYRGNFLEGFYLDHAPRFVEWVTQQREVWHNAMGLLFDRLAQMQEASGQLERAVETATRWVERDPLNEAAYRRLMQLYFACGNPQAALLTYRQCRVILAEQLNMRPADETACFAEQIGAEGYRHRVVTGSQGPGRVMTARPPLAAVFRGFVGRASKMDRLLEIYKYVQSGQTEVVTIKGEAGIGKTCLVEEFLARAAALGADTLSGRAFEAGGSSPYLPLVEMLELRSQQGESDRGPLNDTLSRMLAEMHNYTLQQNHEKTAHMRLLEAFTLLGQALTRQAPVVLFVDDIQWADAASLDMLRYTCRRWTESGTPLLVVLTVRTEALVTIPSFAAWLALLERELRVSSFILNAFPPEETLQFVQTIAAREEDMPGLNARLESCGRWLYSETHGQPFYMTEVLKTLSERNLLPVQRRRDGTWALDFTQATNEKLQYMLPLDVRAIVSARIKQATSTASALLAAAAILGRSFTFAQVCRIAGLNEHEGQAALDEVLKRHLCCAVGDLYVFTHDKLREVVYAEITAQERRALHSRALEVLCSESASAGLLAYHAQEAGLYAQAFQQYVAAGDEALCLFALRDASAYYESARQLLTEKQMPTVLPDTALAAIEHLYIQSGHVCELTDERERAVAIYQAMLAREPNSTTTKCIALNLLALVKPYASEDEDTILLQQGLARDKQEDERGATAETAWQLAQLSVQRFDNIRALPQSEQALHLAREQGVPELVARSLFTAAGAKMLVNEWRDVERYAEEARTLYEGQQDRLMEACCLVQVALAKINAGYPRDGIIATRAAYGVFTEIGHDWGRIYATHHLVAGLLDVGMYEEALTLAQEALALARSSNTRTLLYLGLSALARVQWALLDAAAAYSLHREILSVFGSHIPPCIEGAVAAALCADCAIVGEWPEAQSYATQALAHRSDSTFLYAGLTRWYESEILVRTGYSERVVADLERFGRLVEQSRRYRISYWRAQAALALWHDDVEVAQHYLQEAALLAEEIGLPGEQWLIEVARGDIYRTQGNKAEAQSTLAHAEEIARALANSIEDQQVRAKFLAQVQRMVAYTG